MKTFRHTRVRRYTWISFLRDFLLFLGIFFLIFRFLLGFSLVRGSSMEYTISDGTPVFFNRIVREYRIGDVVAAKVPEGSLYVKRIVAGPGDTVDLREGVLLVNGEPESEISTTGQTFPLEGGVIFPYEVPEDHYFLMGDNREHSRDSRRFGALPEEKLLGRLIGY